jgi:tRNA threonylcarbamoyladenosine biosynthesis protein TsaE
MKLSLLADTKKISKKISKIIKVGDIIFLYGEIGSGKTTFTRFLINHLQVENRIKKTDILSPTFNIVYDYKINKTIIQHYDLYRVKNYKDILELGMFQTLKNSITIVEWPELIKLKPKDRIDIFLSYSKSMTSRNIKIIGFGKWKKYKFNEI